jgi:hypothetical protein
MEKHEEVDTRRSSERALTINSSQDGTKEVAPHTEDVLTSDSTPPATPPAATKADEADWEYVTGLKLHVVIVTVTLACFIMLLDTSIVATVCAALICYIMSLVLLIEMSGYSSNHEPVPFPSRYRLVWKQLFAGQVSILCLFS